MSLAFFDMDGTIIGGDTNDISFDAFLKLGIIDDTVIKKIVNREKTIETLPKEHSNFKEDKQSLLDRLRERYLNRKKERENEQ